MTMQLQARMERKALHGHFDSKIRKNLFRPSKNSSQFVTAVEAFNELCFDEDYDVYILSTAPWNIPNSWTQKRLWVSKYLGDKAHKRLILCNHKNLLRGDILIDDRTANGAGEFEGELIQFGTEKFPNWEQTLKYLLK